MGFPNNCQEIVKEYPISYRGRRATFLPGTKNSLLLHPEIQLLTSEFAFHSITPIFLIEAKEQLV